MGKMDFVLEYQTYMKNLYMNNNEYDIKIYEMFKSYSKNGHLTLTEGLIYTYPTDKTIDLLVKKFPLLQVNKQEDGEIYIEGEMNPISNYLPLFNNLGYFISNLTLDGENWINKFNDNDNVLALFLEAKYDTIVDIPENLYHISPLKFKDKILKNGLIPKSLSKMSYHPDRIYLCDNYLTTIKFGLNLKKDKSDFYKDGFCLFKITPESIDTLYQDVNLKSGYYILHNISPIFLTLKY